jgi:hypothetical protein
VNSSSRLTTPSAERSIPLTTVLANAAPGSVGRVIGSSSCESRPAGERPLSFADLEVGERELRTIGSQG